MRNGIGFRLSLLLGSGLLGAMISPAHAQSGPADEPTAPAGLSAEDEAGKGDVVFVTATKRETDLQDTPIAMAVIAPELIEDNHIQSLFNLSDGVVPSLRVVTFEARQSALTIGMRGIVPFDQNQTARDTGVGTYIDGVYLGRSQGLNAGLFDVERIEVLRGPQGTLFGRNTEGGALSIVTKAPTGVFGGRVTVGAGNYGSYSGELHQDFQEFAGLSVKLDALVQQQDPTTKNPMSGQAGWNQYHRSGARLTGLWKPADTFSAEVSVDYAKDENTPFFSQLVNFNPYGKRVRTLAEVQAGPAAAPAGTINPLASPVKVHTERQEVSDIGTVQQPSLDKTGGVTATLKWDVTPDLELRSITSGRAVSTNQWDNSGVESRNVFAPSATPGSGTAGLFGRYSLSDLYQWQYSQEFQAVGNVGEGLDYVFGLYYFTEHAKESAATPLTNQWNADGTAFIIRNPFGSAPPLNANTQGWEYGKRFIARASHADADSYAAYGQATWTPAAMDQLHLTVGGRYTKDQREGLLYMVSGRATNFTFDFEKSRFDPLVIAAYDLSPDVNVYAKYSTGYRAGGANDRSQNFQAFGPEEVKAYEIGAKTQFLDDMVRLNVAAYAMDRDNTQIDFDNVDTTPGSPTLGAHTEETRNAPGTSEIRGIEADLTAYLTDEWSVGLSYSYTDVKIPDAPFPFSGNSVVPLGSPFPVNVVYTPPNAGSAFINYEVPVGEMTFRGHLDVNYADAQYAFQTEFADVSPTGVSVQHVAVQTDSSFIVNGSIALADINMSASGPSATLSLWARNLLDEEHIYRISAANRGTIGDYANFNPPRTFGVELTVKY